jgi:DNA-binding NtrC family response regulator
MEAKKMIFLVDDDALFLKSLELEFLQGTDYRVETFTTGELCLKKMDLQPSIVVLDFHLDGIDPSAMNGMSTLDEIKKKYPKLPVIMLSSQDKIEVAIDCMHHQAFDYVVKSETAFLRLKKNIETIFRYEKLEKALDWYMERV